MNAAPSILEFPVQAAQPENIPEAVFLLDPAGRISSWSPSAARVTGYTAAEIVGGELAVMYLPEARLGGRPFTELARAARGGESAATGWLLRKDAQRYWADVTLTAMRDGRGMVSSFVCRLRDLSPVRAREELEQARAEERRALEQTRDEVEKAIDVATLLPRIAARAMDLTRADAAILELREGVGDRARAHAGLASLDIELGSVLMPDGAPTTPADIQALRYDQSHESPEILGDVCDRLGIGSMLCVPLVHERDTIGWLAVLSRSSSDFDQAHAASLELMATLLGAPIAQAQASEVHRALIQERARAQAAQRRSEARFRAAMDASLDALFILGAQRDDAGTIADFTILDANRRAEELCGLPAGAFWGQSLSAMPAVARQLAPRDVIAAAVISGRALEQERQTSAPDGRNRWIHEQIVKLDDGVTITARDVTARVEADAEVRRAWAAAEHANRAKTDFVARMSHELRTPLNSVIGFANILLRNRRNALDETELEYLGRVSSAGTHLLALINDILDIAKVESGHMTLELAPVDVVALARSVAAQLEASAQTAGLTLAVEAPSDALSVVGDIGKLRQVLLNLVGNAIKFTPAGHVIVRVVGDGPGGSTARGVEIIDTGIGIQPDRLDAVFDAFEQAESSTARRYGGTGLGLSISRALCEAMGFSLTVASTLGEGTTFSIDFPVD